MSDKIKSKRSDASYRPPYKITSQILARVGEINEWIGRHFALTDASPMPQLRKKSRIRSIQSSLAIEGNRLNLKQVTAIVDGKRVLGHPRDIQEVRNAIAAYESINTFNPFSVNDLLSAHRMMTNGLIDDAGSFRSGGVGVVDGKKIIHLAPPAARVPFLMDSLFAWLQNTQEPPLVAGCIFHYEFEFIHPFSDGNGRVGRLWQTLILSKWRSIFSYMPIESVVRNHQEDYYSTLKTCNRMGDGTAFIEFMLKVIQSALTESDVTEQAAEQVTEQVKRLLVVLKSGALSTRSAMDALSIRHRPTFLYSYLKPALQANLIEMSQPESPRSPTQRYRLTKKGAHYIKQKMT